MCHSYQQQQDIYETRLKRPILCVRVCVCETIFSNLEDNLVTDAPVMKCLISFVLISLIATITN